MSLGHEAVNLLTLIDQAEKQFGKSEVLDAIKQSAKDALSMAIEISELEEKHMAARDNTVVMEGVRIVFRNFAGKEGQYNREGERNFAVLLDDQIAEMLSQDGWNVKWLKPREDIGEEEESPQAYLQVSVSYKGRPPRIVVINSMGRRRNIDEFEVETLDWMDIQNVDLIVRPYEWSVNGKTGIKAYLQSIYVTIQEDALEQKYADLPNQ